MPKRDTDAKGPQQHAEGQQGEKTHAAFLHDLNVRENEAAEAAAGAPAPGFDEFGNPVPGHHRLTEDRQQHDEAEKNSEANRLRR
jgi:hypothetical protein